MDEFIVVLLSPVGNVPPVFPGTLTNAMELVFEHFLLGSYQTALAGRGWRAAGSPGEYPPLAHAGEMGERGVYSPTIKTVSPSRMLGFRSLLNFSIRQARWLIDEGYRNARSQLGDIL